MFVDVWVDVCTDIDGRKDGCTSTPNTPLSSTLPAYYLQVIFPSPCPTSTPFLKISDLFETQQYIKFTILFCFHHCRKVRTEIGAINA